MEPREIAPGVHWVGAAHPDLRMFDDLMPTKRGTTYNSYLILAEKPALIDTVKGMFAARLIENIRRLVDPARIEYVILNHTEPDHSGALRQVLEATPRARVVASRPALHYLRDMVRAPFASQSANHGDELDLGGKTLRFVGTPFLHWPDTMFTWLPQDRLLFSTDAFGSHFCGESVFDDECPPFDAEMAQYYDTILRPFRLHVLEAIDKIKGLDYRMVCPSHGPIRRRDPRQVVRQYQEWATVPAAERPLVVVFYASAHGNTARLAEAVAQGVTEAGGEARLVHVTETDETEQRRVMERACGLMFGCPTIHRDIPFPMWRTLGLLSTVQVTARTAAVFGSFGWSGEARRMIVQRLESMRLKVVDEGPPVKFTPADEDLAGYRQFGRDFVTRMCGCR